MTKNKVQFQAGLSMAKFIVRYGTEAKCAATPELKRRLAVRYEATWLVKCTLFQVIVERRARRRAAEHPQFVRMNPVFGNLKSILTRFFHAVVVTYPCPTLVRRPALESRYPGRRADLWRRVADWAHRYSEGQLVHLTTTNPSGIDRYRT